MISTLAVLVLFSGLAVGLWMSWRRPAALAAASVAFLALVTLLVTMSWPARLALLAVVGFVVWQRRARTSATIGRWSARSRRRAGVASTLEIARHAGTTATRRRAATVRPSLAELTTRQRLAVPTAGVGVELCRVGPQKVWSSIEDVTLVFGGPRTGKTGWLAGRVLDAPGAVLVTSTRTDLLDLCAPLRAQSRGPVFVFNPVGLGLIPSSISFDPLTGCADPVTATERAMDMVAATTRASSGDAERWDAQARRVLAALLHAAALGNGSTRDVLGWVADNDRAAREVPTLLRRSQVESFEKAAEQFVTTNDRTRTSITNSIMPALGWLNHPAAADAASSSGPGAGFDVAELLESKATVFLLGAEEADTGPLVCALTGHIAREARRLAAGRPSGRLDPNLTLGLDEAALISPVPLENWTADMGGRGVTIIAAFQSRAQLLSRYGEHKTATILNNTGSVVLFGGTRDRDDLQFWSTLSGERDERIKTTDMHGQVASRTMRKVPVLAAAQLANLPARTVVVYRRGISPVIGTAKMAWTRHDVRAHHHTTQPAEGWRGRVTGVRVETRARVEAGVEVLRQRLATPTPRATPPAGGVLERVRGTAWTWMARVRRGWASRPLPRLAWSLRRASWTPGRPDSDGVPGGVERPAASQSRERSERPLVIDVGPVVDPVLGVHPDRPHPTQNPDDRRPGPEHHPEHDDEHDDEHGTVRDDADDGPRRGRPGGPDDPWRRP